MVSKNNPLNHVQYTESKLIYNMMLWWLFYLLHSYKLFVLNEILL